MSNFKKDDRVVVICGNHQHEHGKVVNGEEGGILNRTKLIQLDEYGLAHIIVGNLQYERLTQYEVKAVINNVLNQVEKVASQLPAKMRTELQTHVGYLGKALASRDESASKYELDYVMSNLKKASEVGSVTQEWMKPIRIDLEKINWAVKRLS